jgi:polyisoprenoid-binding protein YceI
MTARLLLFAAAGIACAADRDPGQRAIDTRNSTLTVRVYKAGALSAFGHDHEIAAPIAEGAADTAAHEVRLRVRAGTLAVRDAKASEKDRDEIQKTMLGPAVLDAGRFPEIEFHSTALEPAGENAWRVSGDLTLHGETRPVTVDVRENGGHYSGAARFKQTDFGIKPVKIAGGAVRVKDEVRIEFDIQLAR